jgi:hypothetical protein
MHKERFMQEKGKVSNTIAYISTSNMKNKLTMIPSYFIVVVWGTDY